ncbi:MAG: hypothetical protein IJD92_02875 [Bacilli bacterium]|nr:hypothetical protein [Bacilli bacterium]
MKGNFEGLLKKFKLIAKKRWIEGVTLGNGNIGLTFEKEIGKKIDTNYTPDYEDIEIKCTTRYSRFPISLFSLAIDGPSNKEIIRLNQTYGNYDKDFKEKKTLIRKIRVNELSDLNKKYYLSLCLEGEKLFICVYNKNKVLIEKKAYVELENIRKHLLIKLKNLAIIKASKKILNNIEYFRYYEIQLYELKNFYTFKNLLKNGLIEVSIISRISKSGDNKGRYCNKNLVFQIKKDNIEKLFNKVTYYNYDENNFKDFQII